MKSLFDANVIVSAIVFDGNELEAIRISHFKEYEIFLSEHIGLEVTRTLLEKFPEHHKLIAEFVKLAGFITIPKEKYMDRIDKITLVRDRYDRHVLACAEETNCDYIVTGDKDLHILKEYKGIRIVNAREYLRTVKRE